MQIDIDAMPKIPQNDRRFRHNQTHLSQFMAEKIGRRGRAMYSLWGRTEQKNSKEKVRAKWMAENGMGKHFQNYLKSRLKRWTQHPVGKSLVSTEGIKVHEQPDGSRFYSHGGVHECTPCAILSALSHIGADKKEDQMVQMLKEFKLAHDGTEEQRHKYTPGLKRYLRTSTSGNMTFTQSTKTLEGTRGFHVDKVKGLEDYDLLQCKPEKLVVAQICAAPYRHFNNRAFRDNQHSIVVTRGLIFDANMRHPISLSEDSLDKCCVGGSEFVLHHVSRAFEYTPTAITADVCAKTIRKRHLTGKRKQPTSLKQKNKRVRHVNM